MPEDNRKIRAHDLLTNQRTAEFFSTIPRTSTIIDVGAGIIPCDVFPCKHIAIEPHGEYASILREQWGSRDNIVIEETVDIIDSYPRTDTTVLLLDVIEHLEKDHGERIVRIAESFQQAVLFTPLGFQEQGGENPDPWGLNGGKWQKHRSGWLPEDFERWNVIRFDKFHQAHGALLCYRW